MEQISSNVMVINVGEDIPPGTEDALKILLLGSVDLGPTGEMNWQSKFINGLAQAVDPQKGLMNLFTKYNYVILNNWYSPQNGELNIFNQEAVNKFQWERTAMSAADCIFMNFLGRSLSPIPLYQLGYLNNSRKIIVRCPEVYKYYSLVKMACDASSVPLVGSKMGTVNSILSLMFSFCPKFQEVANNVLPD